MICNLFHVCRPRRKGRQQEGDWNKPIGETLVAGVTGYTSRHVVSSLSLSLALQLPQERETEERKQKKQKRQNISSRSLDDGWEELQTERVWLAPFSNWYFITSGRGLACSDERQQRYRGAIVCHATVNICEFSDGKIDQKESTTSTQPPLLWAY